MNFSHQANKGNKGRKSFLALREIVLVLAIMALLSLTVCAQTLPNTSYTPVLPNYWYTMVSTNWTNTSVALSNGVNTNVYFGPNFLSKNGAAFMVQINTTNSVASQAQVVTLSADVTLDGKTNTSNQPLTWSFTNAAGTNVTGTYWVLIPLTQVNNVAGIVIDGATNATAHLAQTNVVTTINWIEWSVIY